MIKAKYDKEREITATEISGKLGDAIDKEFPAVVNGVYEAVCRIMTKKSAKLFIIRTLLEAFDDEDEKDDEE